MAHHHHKCASLWGIMSGKCRICHFLGLFLHRIRNQKCSQELKKIENRLAGQAKKIGIRVCEVSFPSSRRLVFGQEIFADISSSGGYY